MDVRDVGVHAEGGEVGDAGQGLALGDRDALFGDHPREHARAIRTGRGEIQLAPRFHFVAAQLGDLQVEAGQFRARGFLRVVAFGAQLLELDGRLRRRQFGPLQELLREQAFGGQLLVALELRLERGQLQFLHVGAAFDVDQALLQREPFLLLGVGLDGQVLRKFVHREPRLADVELQDRLAGGQLRAGALDDAQHAGLDRAGDHLLDLGHDQARRADGRVDGAALDDRRPDGVAPQAGGNQAGQPQVGDDGQRERRAADGEAAAGLAARDVGVERAVHGVPSVASPGPCGRAISGLFLQRGARWRPGPYDGCSEVNRRGSWHQAPGTARIPPHA